MRMRHILRCAALLGAIAWSTPSPAHIGEEPQAPLFLAAAAPLDPDEVAPAPDEDDEEAALEPAEKGSADPRDTPPPGKPHDGVIRPPAIGDEAAVKRPLPDKVAPMPVIPPPGTPGGNPNLKPK